MTAGHLTHPGLRSGPTASTTTAPPTEPDRTYLVDVLAPALLVIHFVLTWQPLVLLLILPGFLSSFGFPAAAVLVLLLTPTDRLARIPVPFTLVAFLGWLALSYAWTIEPFATSFAVRTLLPGLLLISLITAVIPVERVVQVLLVLFVVVGVISLLASLAFSNSRQQIVYDGGFPGIQAGFRGLFNHKNHLGIFGVFAVCLTLPFVRTRARFPLIVLFVGLVVGSRSATAASGLFAVAFVWFWLAAIDQQSNPRARRLLGALSIASAVGAVLLAFGILPSLLDLYQKDMTFSGRTVIWDHSLEMLGDSPIIGFGFGAPWANGANPITADVHRRIGFGAAHSHNGGIEILLQGGVIGLGLLVVFMAQVVRRSGALLAHPTYGPYGQWGLLVFLSLLLMQISEPLFDGGPLAMVIVVWTVLTRIHNQIRRDGLVEHRYVTTL